MMNDRTGLEQSEFFRYLASVDLSEGDRLPPLAELSHQLGISIASLREQLEVARALGLVEVKPKTGIRRLKYAFQPAVLKSLAYATSIDVTAFESYSSLRNHIEMTYWNEAVTRLTPEDLSELIALVISAKAKLSGPTIQLPHQEHRELHMIIYRRLDNPFVTGLLEAYWTMYEAVGLNVYTDLAYLEKVWNYHEKMVNFLGAGDFSAGYQSLVEHMNLIFERSKPVTNQKFE